MRVYFTCEHSHYYDSTEIAYVKEELVGILGIGHMRHQVLGVRN